MKKKNRLTLGRDFKRLKDEGEKLVHPLVVLLVCKNNSPETRTAVVASKAVGGAVVRNLIKRRLKACINLFWNNIETGWDLIFYSRTAVRSAGFEELCSAVKHLLKKADVWIE